MDERSAQERAEPAQVDDVSTIGLAEQVKHAKSASKISLLAMGAVALVAVAAGITGRVELALWCLPVFFVAGMIANAMRQDVRRLTSPTTPASVGRQVGEGILLVALAPFFVVLLFIVLFYQACGLVR